MNFNLLADDASASGTGSSWQTYLILGIIIVAFIAFFIWSTYSSKKKQKQAQEMVDSIKIGDKVKTIGGICGYVAEINNEENTIVLETGLDGDKSFIKFDKAAIYQTNPVGTTAPASSDSGSTVDGKKID